MNEYICNICGSVLETNVEKEEISEYYVCPFCVVDKGYSSQIDS